MARSTCSSEPHGKLSHTVAPFTYAILVIAYADWPANCACVLLAEFAWLIPGECEATAVPGAQCHGRRCHPTLSPAPALAQPDPLTKDSLLETPKGQKEGKKSSLGAEADVGHSPASIAFLSGADSFPAKGTFSTHFQVTK